MRFLEQDIFDILLMMLKNIKGARRNEKNTIRIINTHAITIGE